MLETAGINVGIAESNMSGIAEAFAAKGYNVWHSTFGVFFDWRVLRRITVSQQERMESISKSDGWLSEGHQLDITLFSTASNIDTGVNGRHPYEHRRCYRAYAAASLAGNRCSLSPNDGGGHEMDCQG